MKVMVMSKFMVLGLWLCDLVHTVFLAPNLGLKKQHVTLLESSVSGVLLPSSPSSSTQ